MAQHDVTTTVKMQHFENVKVLTKNGEKKKYLKAVETDATFTFIANFISNNFVETDATFTFIANFISNNLGKIVHHRNQLKHYRNTIAIFRESFDALFVDINFSENLSVLVKFEPQSLHWSHEQVTVHSGITKACCEKNYHVHLSHDKKQEQFVLHLALTNMINNTNAPDHSYIVTERDI